MLARKVGRVLKNESDDWFWNVIKFSRKEVSMGWVAE
jgi:hypothetical protein